MEQNCLFIRPEKYEEAINALRERGFDIMDLVNGVKNTEIAPKYAPSRLFKKGDIVEPRKGREVYACEWEDCVFHKLAGTYKVCNDEREGHVSVIDKETGVDCYVSSFALELVTPVEEIEPYKVDHVKALKLFEVCHYEMGDDTVEKEGELHKIVRTIYWYGKSQWDRTEEEAQADAEAERDRLNAEYRKEKNNG